MGGISIWQLLIIAVIVVLLFGTKKLRNLGGDLGSAVKGFKNAMGDEKTSEQSADKSSESLANKDVAPEDVNKEKATQKENSQA